MIKRLLFLLCLGMLAINASFAQVDSVFSEPEKTQVSRNYSYRYPDSATRARQLFVRDSLKALGDSLARVWISQPNPNRPNKFVDSLINLYQVENLDFNAWAAKFPKKVNRFDEGKPRLKGEIWVISVILFLILFYALIRFFFARELNTIVHSFYSNQVLSQMNKEDNIFVSWPFIFLYVLFALIIGMYLYLTGRYIGLEYEQKGIELFLLLSLIVLILFTFKILMLRILGFIFDVKRLVREYVSILYLSYFNTALLFLPLIIAFSLTPSRHAGIYGYLGGILFVGIFLIQFIRAGTNILTSYKFPKVYLIIYLCALEFCPLVILFKELRF